MFYQNIRHNPWSEIMLFSSHFYILPKIALEVTKMLPPDSCRTYFCILVDVPLQALPS